MGALRVRHVQRDPDDAGAATLRLVVRQRRELQAHVGAGEASLPLRNAADVGLKEEHHIRPLFPVR